jgi:simple sugar transport system permease protein
MVTGPMKAPGGSTPTTALTAATANLPVILKGTRLHLGFILLILFLIGYKLFMWHTPRGYQMRVVGMNPNAAAYSGINASHNIMLSLAISGGLGGVAGACEILGVQHKLIQGFSNNYGYTGIAVGLLGSCMPMGIFLASVLFAALQSGGNNLQMLMQVPSAVMFIIQGFVVIFVVSDIFGGFRKLTQLKNMLDRTFQSGSRPTGPSTGERMVE